MLKLRSSLQNFLSFITIQNLRALHEVVLESLWPHKLVWVPC